MYIDRSTSGGARGDTSGTALGSALGPDWSSGVKMIGNNKEKVKVVLYHCFYQNVYVPITISVMYVIVYILN